MMRIGSFIRVTRDTPADEPLVEGMVGKVVADVYGKTDPASQALVVMAGARKACAVPLEAVEVISESDYGDEAGESKDLWRARKKLWRKRHGALPHAKLAEDDEGADDEDDDAPEPPALEGHAHAEQAHLSVPDLIRRTEAVQSDEIVAIASPALVALLTEWSVGALDILADLVPGFADLAYKNVRLVRSDHVERWLWDGVRLYLGLRSHHPALGPVTAEPARERVRALFERIDDGEPAERLADFSLDVPAVKKALAVLASHWLDEAVKSFARELADQEVRREELGRYILQLHIVGFQVAFCADAAHHGLPAH